MTTSAPDERSDGNSQIIKGPANFEGPGRADHGSTPGIGKLAGQC
jgi:hypothetical protein